MIKAIDVANFFIDIANSNPENDDCITNLRVNKLLYFAQGYSLARRNKPLFDEDMQAWQYGPVVPDVYYAFRPCGRERISDVSGNYSSDIFSSDELELLIDIVREYGKYSTSALINFAHRKGTPWESVFDKTSNNIIPKDLLKEYFSKQTELKSFVLPEVSEDDYIGYRDPADNILVLPKELDDDSQ